jgi:hypothetical protein
MKRSVFICLIILSAIHAPAFAGASPFVSVFPCDEANIDDIDEDLCVIGNFRAGQTVFLLSDDVVCHAETGEPFLLEREVGPEFMIAPVDTGDCDDAEYYLAYRGSEPKQFRPLTMEHEKSAKIRARVNETLRNGHLTRKLIDAFEGTLKAEPILYKPFPKRADILLVHYITEKPREEDALYGPLFWYTKDRVHLIDSQASIAAYFRMQGQQYLLLRHSCWEGCGERSDVVFHLSEERISLIHQDDSFSE